MKCEICGHKIPINQNECPNCGNKIEKEHQITYHVNSSSHEHVKVNRTRKKKSFKPIFIIFFVVCFFCGLLGGLFFGFLDETFESYIEDIGDENNTIAQAIKYRDYVEDYLEGKGLKNIEHEENIDDEELMKASCIFSCSDNVADYTLSFTFTDGKQSELVLNVSMEEVDYNIVNSLRNLNVFNELLDRDIAKDIKQIREEHLDDNKEDALSSYKTIEVDFSDDKISVNETTDYNFTEYKCYYNTEYTIAGNGYKIHE